MSCHVTNVVSGDHVMYHMICHVTCQVTDHVMKHVTVHMTLSAHDLEAKNIIGCHDTWYELSICTTLKLPWIEQIEAEKV